MIHLSNTTGNVASWIVYGLTMTILAVALFRSARPRHTRPPMNLDSLLDRDADLGWAEASRIVGDQARDLTNPANEEGPTLP